MRLVIVWRGDPDGYGWAPAPRANDVVVAFDDVAAADFGPGTIRFDDLRTWTDLNDDEHRIVSAFEQLMANPALQGASLGGCRLTDFFEHSLRVELPHVVRGWTVARSAPQCRVVIADPACPAAAVVGAHAGLGLDPPDVEYAPDHSPTWQSSLPRRLVGNGLVHAAACVPQGAKVRIAATANYKVTPALTAAPARELRDLGVALMPLPGLDPRDAIRATARVRLPILRTLAPMTGRGAPPFELSGDLSVSTGSKELDDAFSEVATRLARLAWPQLWQAVRATGALERRRGLRALLLPTMFPGTPRVFTAWARQRDIKLAVLQHGLYAHRRFDGQDRGADVVLTWGDAVAHQTRDWGGSPPACRTVGCPSIRRAAVLHERPRRVRRVLLTTTGPHIDSYIFPAAIHDTFLAAVLPGIRQMQRDGIEVALRVAPSETPERYARAFEIADMAIPLAKRVAIGDAIRQHDLVICPFSSVALEASALGVPSLMCLPSMPDAFAREHLVPPWTESLPGVFHDAEGFLELIDGIAGDDPPAIATGLQLASFLREYVQPFDETAFTSALRELSA